VVEGQRAVEGTEGCKRQTAIQGTEVVEEIKACREDRGLKSRQRAVQGAEGCTGGRGLYRGQRATAGIKGRRKDREPLEGM
jgi:hypothetical protein